MKKGVFVIWYVLYCPNQKEEEALYACKRHLTREALADAFVFTYDRMRRYGGAWHLERQPLFPHYLFLESRNEEKLQEELRQYSQVLSVFESDGKLVWVADALRCGPSFTDVTGIYPGWTNCCDGRAFERKRESHPED